MVIDDTVVKDTLQTNYYGTLTIINDLLPLMRYGGRIVNVASTSGRLGEKYSPALKSAFISASETSVPACTALMSKFANDVKAKREKEEGWPSAAYAVSKAGLIAASKRMAWENEGTGIRIEFCCPGYVNTDMTKGRGPKTPDQGAQTPVLLALGDLKGEVGDFWRGEKVVSWE